jgi:hypothetical protein
VPLNPDKKQKLSVKDFNNLTDAKYAEILGASPAPFAWYLRRLYGLDQPRIAYSGRSLNPANYAAGGLLTATGTAPYSPNDGADEWSHGIRERYAARKQPPIQPQNDNTIIEVIEGAEGYVEQLLAALNNVTNVQDNPGAREIALISGDKISLERKKAVCRVIMVSAWFSSLWAAN